MTDLGRGIESEIPSVPDVPPKAVTDYKRKSKKKPSAEELIDNVYAPSPKYRPLVIPERPTQSLVTNKKTPIEYFSIFFTPDWLQRFAEFTNENALQKRQFSGEENGETYTTSPHQKEPPKSPPPRRRPWNRPTSGPEIGVFIGSLLIMGLEGKDRVPLYWSGFCDIGGNQEIIKVNHLNNLFLSLFDSQRVLLIRQY
jgi:hypothetical protein